MKASPPKHPTWLPTRTSLLLSGQEQRGLLLPVSTPASRPSWLQPPGRSPLYLSASQSPAQPRSRPAEARCETRPLCSSIRTSTSKSRSVRPPLSLYKGSYALGHQSSHRAGVASCTPGEGKWLVSHGQSVLFSRLWRRQRGSQPEQRGGREHCPGALMEGGQVPAPCAQSQLPGWGRTCPACSRGPSRSGGGGDSSRGDRVGGLQHLRHLEKLIERGSLNTKKTVQRGPPSTCKGVAPWGAQARTSLPSSPWEARALCWRRPGQRRPESPRPFRLCRPGCLGQSLSAGDPAYTSFHAVLTVRVSPSSSIKQNEIRC